MVFYNNLDIKFIMDGFEFHAVNISSAAIKHNIPLHSHGKNCYEIHYISESFGILNADGEEYKITPNTLFVTGPLISHAQITDLNNPMVEWCIYLRIDDTGAADGTASEFLKENFWIGQDEQDIFPLFKKVFTELKNRFDGYINMAALLISEIIISTARNYINNVERKGEICGCISERTSIIIEEYFLYEYRYASLGELSGRLELSPRQTQRVLEKLYGSSFTKMKNKARMSAATMLLSDNTLSLTDVSERLGYSTQEYFTTTFKAYYNISPGKYRKSKFRKL